MLRELARMSYLWREPHRLVDIRLGKLIETIPHTPLEQALDATLAELQLAPPAGSNSAAAAA